MPAGAGTTDRPCRLWSEQFTKTLIGGQKVDADTTTSLAAKTANPTVYGQPILLCLQVTAVAPGAGTPSGNIDILDGGVTVDSTDINGVRTHLLSTGRIVHTVVQGNTFYALASELVP